MAGGGAAAATAAAAAAPLPLPMDEMMFIGRLKERVGRDKRRGTDDRMVLPQRRERGSTQDGFEVGKGRPVSLPPRLLLLLLSPSLPVSRVSEATFMFFFCA